MSIGTDGDAARSKARKRSKDRTLIAMDRTYLQAPALLNLFTGVRLMGENPNANNKTPDELLDAEAELNSMSLASGIGTAWLGLTAGMSMLYTYKDGLRKLSGSQKNKRANLARERCAEELLKSKRS